MGLGKGESLDPEALESMIKWATQEKIRLVSYGLLTSGRLPITDVTENEEGEVEFTLPDEAVAYIQEVISGVRSVQA